MIPPSPTPLESLLDLLCRASPPPIPVIVAVRVGDDIELQVHPLNGDDPLGSAGDLAVGPDVDAVVAAVPALLHPSGVHPPDLAGTLVHLVGRSGEAHTRWVDANGAVCQLDTEPGIDGGQLHQRVRAILDPPGECSTDGGSV